jgi:hypothetical protein
MTSWAADADEHTEAWGELLAGAVSKDLLQAAVARVAPRESQFESAEGVDAALTAAGFAGVEVHPVALEYTIALDRFLADRELSSAGRFARHTLGADSWSRLVARAREVLGSRFGSAFECTRGVLIGLARGPRDREPRAEDDRASPERRQRGSREASNATHRAALWASWVTPSVRRGQRGVPAR